MQHTMFLLCRLALLLAFINGASMQSVEEIPLVEKKEIIFTIEHAIGGRDFMHRSTIHLIKKSDGKQGLLFPEKNGVFGEDMQVIREMLEKNELYTIRIKSQVGNVSSEPVITSLPMCELQKSGFKEDIVVYLDREQTIHGVSYSSPAGTISRECDPTKLRDSLSFQTRIKVGESVPIQSIPLQAIGSRPANMQEVRLGDGDASMKPPQQSFLQRYRYMAVILVIYLYKEGAAPAGAAAAKRGN
mmetsp:Transcript_1916/g.4461  ORF Transcript_1916/g.4461 Transcript_1916/m.4461 type:complete len:244 (+) Transcript_1916:152-883(+)